MEPDRFLPDQDSEFLAEHALISACLSDKVSQVERRKTDAFGEVEAQIVSRKGDEKMRMILALRERLNFLDPRVLASARAHGLTSKWHYVFSLPPEVNRLQFLRATCEDLLRDIVANKAALEPHSALDTIVWLTKRDVGMFILEGPMLGSILTLAEGLPHGTTIPENVRNEVEAFIARQSLRDFDQLRRLGEALGGRAILPMEKGEAWSDTALADLNALPPAEFSNWAELLAHARATTASSPSAKWLKSAAIFVKSVRFERFRDAVARWFPLVDQPRTTNSGTGYYMLPAGSLLLSEMNMDVLRGLAWMCGLQEDHELARAITTLALSAYRKVPGKGPRAVRVGNACVTALGMMPGLDAVGQLALLKVKVKFGTAQIAIGKALSAAAEREGLAREELEEMSVPSYGLTEVGRTVETLGDFTAELKVVGTKSVDLIWRRADGKVQKSLPAAVKKEFADEFKELNAAKKDIEKMLPAQAERIDSLFLQQKT